MLAIVIFSFLQTAWAQSVPTSPLTETLYFYGPTVETDDNSKIQLSTDLFYSQFQLEGNFTLIDRRNEIFDNNALQSQQGTNAIIFYNEVKEDKDKWYLNLYLIDISKNKEVSVKYVYDEYYRILIDAKDALSELLQKYERDSSLEGEIEESSTIENTASSVSITNLFGTWQGEEHVDKIVILRGGRGFVIFENGASMNISVRVEGTSFFAIQESKPNASFFPELPREVALVKALEVDPIEWELTIENENSLVGVKHAYTAEGENTQANIIKAEIPVKWYR